MESTQDLIFKGYRNFKGKKDPEKVYFVLNFMTQPIVTDKVAYCQDIDIFVDKEVYNNFIKSNDLLSNVEVNCHIVGNKVQYIIAD